MDTATPLQKRMRELDLPERIEMLQNEAKHGSEEAADELEKIRLAMEAYDKAEKPIVTDNAPFAAFLRAQVHRKDRVGALARVAMKDVTWPRDADRKELTEYFQKMGARGFVMASLAQAWEEFGKDQRRGRTRQRNRQARKARRKNRR